MPAIKLDTFTQAYIETLFWLEEDNPEFEDLTIDDMDPDCLARIVSDCEQFQGLADDLISEDRCDWSQAGYDFYLTRHRHGAGFWDGGWPEHGDKLTEISRQFPETWVYVGDDGKIYVS